MIIKTVDPKKSKLIVAGTFKDGIFYKKVSPKHYMVKERGYGIQEDVIQQLKELGCTMINTKTKTHEYLFNFTELLHKGLRNYGHGDQRFLRVIK